MARLKALCSETERAQEPGLFYIRPACTLRRRLGQGRGRAISLLSNLTQVTSAAQPFNQTAFPAGVRKLWGDDYPKPVVPVPVVVVVPVTSRAARRLRPLPAQSYRQGSPYVPLFFNFPAFLVIIISGKLVLTHHLFV